LNNVKALGSLKKGTREITEEEKKKETESKQRQ
jgi:hypothetical protein